MDSRQVIVIGAGASGMMAAGRAAECGAPVMLLEKTDGPGKKLLLSGSGRGNLTNVRDLAGFIEMFGPNGRFLYPAFRRFFRDDLLAFLEHYGVATITEPDGRVFPASNRAADVLAAFRRYLDQNDVRLAANSGVLSVKVENSRVSGVETQAGIIPAGAVILAAGGASYAGTGSSGDGYRMAEKLGHSIVKPRPALVPLTIKESGLAVALQGVSLGDARVTAWACPADGINTETPQVDSGRGTGVSARPPVIESRRGEMLFTHFGISGPVVLLMSLAVYEALENSPVSVSIDMRPDEDLKMVSKEMQSRLDAQGRRTFKNILAGTMPLKMVPEFLEMTDISGEKLGHQVTGKERDRIVGMMKSFRLNIRGTLPLFAAMVTAGGVSLKEIDPRTMGSRLIEGLFFCGEVMDIDAATGGYNLQAAFSTGYLAGESAAEWVKTTEKQA